MSEQIRRQFTVPFPIDKVKTAIEDNCRTNAGGHQLRDRNAAFNTYSISLVRMLNVLPVTVTLTKISDAECGFELSAVPGPQLSRMPTVTSSMIEDFLKRVGEFAAGRLVVKVTPPLTPEQQEQKKKRARKAIVIMLIILAAMGYGLYKLFNL